MTNYNERLDEIFENLNNKAREERASCTERNNWEGYNSAYERLEYEAKQALTSLIKELVAEAIGEDESLVEVHKQNLVVASQFNAVVKSRNSLRHKQRQALKNLLKELEEV